MVNYKIVKSDELYHHGILGQKWGVRRFQDADGSLKSAGKKRYSSDLNTKTDSNGIRYGQAKSKDEIHNLVNQHGDSMTAEGLAIKSDTDRKMFLNYLNNKGVNTNNLSIISINGKDMNNAYKLKGSNAYKDDFHFQVFTGLDNSEAYNALSPLHCRWLDDIVANNIRNN